MGAGYHGMAEWYCVEGKSLEVGVADYRYGTSFSLSAFKTINNKVLGGRTARFVGEVISVFMFLSMVFFMVVENLCDARWELKFDFMMLVRLEADRLHLLMRELVGG